jgi:hypothetical protein
LLLSPARVEKGKRGQTYFTALLWTPKVNLITIIKAPPSLPRCGRLGRKTSNLSPRRCLTTLYAGRDLHAKSSFFAIIDGCGKRVFHRRVYRTSLAAPVGFESTRMISNVSRRIGCALCLRETKSLGEKVFGS